jgi:hypothetical protein
MLIDGIMETEKNYATPASVPHTDCAEGNTEAQDDRTLVVLERIK